MFCFPGICATIASMADIETGYNKVFVICSLEFSDTKEKQFAELISERITIFILGRSKTWRKKMSITENDKGKRDMAYQRVGFIQCCDEFDEADQPIRGFNVIGLSHMRCGRQNESPVILIYASQETTPIGVNGYDNSTMVVKSLVVKMVERDSVTVASQRRKVRKEYSARARFWNRTDRPVVFVVSDIRG